MKKSDRHRHPFAGRTMDIAAEKTPAGKEVITSANMSVILQQDIRAVLHDLLDQQKETNRILRMAFGVTKEKTDVDV